MPTDARGDWNVLQPQAAAPLFLALDASWWVTGGWALDLFLRRERTHRDLDIAVLRREQDAVRSHLAAWDLQVVHDGLLTAWPPGERLPIDRTTVWARPAKYLPWQLEIFFESTEADEWVYCRDDRVRLPLISLGLLTPDGVPFVRPEVVLLYRATRAPAATDEADVRAVADRLSAAGRRWLIEALTAAHPGHRWIGQI
jgi:hypothetical protein